MPADADRRSRPADGAGGSEPRAVLSWSGGKDAAYAYHVLREADATVVELLTTINAAYDRSSMHGVRRALYDRQAAALGLPINVVELPADPSNAVYEATMEDVLAGYRRRGIDRVVFGDIALEDVRAYREDRLDGSGVAGRWPLWGRDTTALVSEFLAAGFRAITVAVDADALDESFVGRDLDAGFLADLPDAVDPAGENGEFHTFVWDGPGFEKPVAVERGPTVTRSVGEAVYHYADLRAEDR